MILRVKPLCGIFCLCERQSLFNSSLHPLSSAAAIPWLRWTVVSDSTGLFLVSGKKPVQKAFHSQQRGDPHSSANGRRLTQIQNYSGQRQVGAREQRDRLVNQVLPCELTPSLSTTLHCHPCVQFTLLWLLSNIKKQRSVHANSQFASWQGGKEYLMRAHFGLPSVEAEDKEGKPPISVKFEIPYFTTSGIQVHPVLEPTWLLSGLVSCLHLCACEISLRAGFHSEPDSFAKHTLLFSRTTSEISRTFLASLSSLI